MKDERYWNDKTMKGSIRQMIAEFIQGNDRLQKFNESERLDLETKLAEFLYKNSYDIATKVRLQDIRNDVQEEIYSSIDNGQAAETIIDAIPFRLINATAIEARNNEDDDDAKWELYRLYLRDSINTNLPYIDDLFDVGMDEAWLYAAYLDEWYKTHDESMRPVSWEEFKMNEMMDEELAQHYRVLAEKYRTKKDNKDETTDTNN